MAPAECPGKQSVVVGTSALIRHQPSVPISATVTITRLAVGYRLELDVEGGKQRIFSESCSSLVHTAEVILALAIDLQTRGSGQASSGQRHPNPAEPSPEAAAVAGSAAPAASATALPSASPTIPLAVALPVPSAVPRAPPSRPAPTSSKPNPPAAAVAGPTSPVERPQRSYWNPELHPALQFLVEYGMLPHVAYGPRLGLWIDQAHWSLSTTAEWLVPEWWHMPNSDPSRGGHISFLGGQVDSCLVIMGPRLAQACVGVEAGDMMGKGSGVANTQLGQGIWLAPAAGVELRPKLGAALGADLHLGMAFPVKRPAFGFEGYSSQFVPKSWSLRLASGFSWF